MRLAVFASGALLALFGALAPGGAEGRAGNEALAAGEPAAAEALYASGLAQADTPPEARAALFHNLGVARARAGRHAQADSSFADALPWAASPAARASALYGAGTAALASGDNAGALRALRSALILRPGHGATRVNLEIALLRQRRDGDGGPARPEPSDFAQRLKAQADSLVERRRYAEALELFQSGLALDSTVQAFGDEIQRLGSVVEIDTASASGAAPAPRPSAP